MSVVFLLATLSLRVRQHDRRSRETFGRNGTFRYSGPSYMLYTFEETLDVFDVFLKGIGVNYDVADINQEHRSLQYGKKDVQGWLEGRWRVS